jgi:hypothetical protein
LRPQADEFVRRFLLHVLPPGFQGIRHFGMLTNRTREAKLQQGRHHLLKSPAPAAATPDESEDYRDRYWLLSGAKMPS